MPVDASSFEWFSYPTKTKSIDKREAGIIKKTISGSISEGYIVSSLLLHQVWFRDIVEVSDSSP